MARQRLDMMIRTVKGLVDSTGSEIRCRPDRLFVAPVRIPVKSNSRALRDNPALEEYINKYLRHHPNIVPAEANAYLREDLIIEREKWYYPISFYRI